MKVIFPVWSIVDDEWGFRVGGWSPRQLHIPVRTGGIFYFPWHRHRIEGTNGFYCLIRKRLASGVNGIAKVPKRKVFTLVNPPAKTVRGEK